MESWSEEGVKIEDEEVTRKLSEAMFEMANTDENKDFLNRDEFNRFVDYYKGWNKEKDWPMTPDGQVDWAGSYKIVDYNQNGMIDNYEMVNAMMRDGWSLEHMKMMMETANQHMNEGGEMDFDQWMMFVKDAENMMEEMKGGDSRGPRMEIHMEENADGSSRMTIIMEGAKLLAASAAAVAAATFYSL
jgi:hypothetical protein